MTRKLKELRGMEISSQRSLIATLPENLVISFMNTPFEKAVNVRNRCWHYIFSLRFALSGHIVPK